jgi:ATP-dependent RNA helicase RhlE
MSHKFFGGRKGPSRFQSGQYGRKKFGPKTPKISNKSKIDLSKLVNKALPVEEKTEYTPSHRFEDFAVDQRLKINVAKKGYLKPTPIQDQTIQHILEGKDLVGIANTGTGKTAAFLIPLLNKVLHDRRQVVLILAPTRELALQTHEEFNGFSMGTGLHAVLCIGGSSIGMQISHLRRGYNFVIGTPGRIKDLIQRRVLNLGNIKNVVVDEADRMLDMGFIHDIKYLLELLPKERQSLFFSATIDNDVAGLINSFLKNPVTVSVKVRETAANVQQDVIRVENGKKRIEVLQELLSKKEFNKVLIFGRTKHGVEKLSVSLAERGFKVASIHGNKSQSQRQSALRSFKENRVQALVATDVAARGLDINNVSHVINYDMPSTYDDYIHRIGRTGRADKLGVALTFV